MGVRVHQSEPRARPRPRGPGLAPTLAVFVVCLLVLLANGRPVGDPDPSGLVGWLGGAASLLAGSVIKLDVTGRLIVGKALAATFAALAGAFLFAAAGRRHTVSDARWAAFALAFGTTLAAAAQTLSAEAAAACGIASALWLLARAEAEEDPAIFARAGLPLALAVGFQPSTLPLALVLVGGALLRWRQGLMRLVLWTAPGALLAVAGALFAASASVARATPGDPLALLASPAKGALVFVPAALVGLVGAVRATFPRPRRWDEAPPSRGLALSCGLGFIAHLTSIAVIGGWADGVFWGPRLLAPAWPLLMLFLPEGLAALKLLGSALLLLSFGVQAIGAVSYDGRWDRLHRGAGGELKTPWDAVRSPIAFQLGERVARPAFISVRDGRLAVRELPVGGLGTTGSFVSFSAGRLRPTGVDATMENLRLEGGARVTGDRLELTAPGDAVAFRVREGARPRRLELRLAGGGHGTLGVGESSLGQDVRWRDSGASGTFRLRVPYRFADSGGPEIRVALRAGGPVWLDSVALVPPSEPEKVLRLP